MDRECVKNNYAISADPIPNYRVIYIQSHLAPESGSKKERRLRGVMDVIMATQITPHLVRNERLDRSCRWKAPYAK